MMKKIAFLLIGTLLLSACGTAAFGSMSEMSGTASASASVAESAGDTAAAGGYHKITAEQAKEKMDAGGVTVVDVRTEAEYQEGHISGAVLVPNESISDTMPEALPDKSAVLLVYCRSGRRSKEASDKLVALDYENVYDFGGIIDWPYEVVTE